MNITINQELRAYIDPLTTHEYEALERSILSEGCRDALVLWGEVLIDGHNRYAICQKHNLQFATVQNNRFGSIQDVMLWMIDNHLARRSVSDFQRGVLALRKKEIVASRAKLNEPASDEQDPASPATAEPKPKQSREELAKIAGISSNAITQIEKIQKAATPELVEAVRAGTISINAAATIASLPSEQQLAAVAGGRKELQQAAKQVREMKAGKRAVAATPSVPSDQLSSAAQADASPELVSPDSRIAELTAENAALRAKIAELSLALETAQQVNTL